MKKGGSSEDDKIMVNSTLVHLRNTNNIGGVVESKQGKVLDSSFGPWGRPSIPPQGCSNLRFAAIHRKKKFVASKDREKKKKKVRDLESGERKVKEKFAQDTEREGGRERRQEKKREEI